MHSVLRCFGFKICTLHCNVISVKTLFVLLQLRALPSFLVRHFLCPAFSCPAFSCPAISCLAISCPAISCRANWSVIFTSCNFTPCTLVRQFHASCNFMPCNFDGPSFSCPSFSVNPSNCSVYIPTSTHLVSGRPGALEPAAVSHITDILNQLRAEIGKILSLPKNYEIIINV